MTDLTPSQEILADTSHTTLDQSFNEPSELTIDDLVKYLGVVDQRIMAVNQKVEWMCKTLEWMAGVFQGLQAVASMMPGKAGKIAAQVAQQAQNGGQPNG